MNIFINHIGYEPQTKKVFIVEAPEDTRLGDFSLINAQTLQCVFQGKVQAQGRVQRWKDWFFWTGDFSSFELSGRYYLKVERPDGEPLRTDSFEIAAGLYKKEILSDVLHYFKSQRSTYIWDRSDKNARIWDSEETVDARGGWYDASGDVSKYLSHLSYSNFMNPQQTPMVVWNFLEAMEFLRDSRSFFLQRLNDEILHGADFLVRMQHRSGAFFMTLFDKWSKDVDQRDLCAYSTRAGTKSSDWQASYRQGGGVAIAALARTAKLGESGDFSSDDYLKAAERGFEHLEVNGPKYCDDGKENIIDDYCALLAATELLATTGKKLYAEAAERRAKQLVGRLTEQGWWKADDLGERSYFHAAEAGLPVVSLLRFLKVHPQTSLTDKIFTAVRKSLAYEVELSSKVCNPFGYPRQFVKMPGKAAQDQFFIPHENESGYWWQGENARLASISAAALLASDVVPDLDPRVLVWGDNAFHWILGRNPYDMCMLHGKGHNNPQYEPGYFPAPGGVCNGITAGVDDEDDIDFLQTEVCGHMESWRWGEQWIPHGSWLFLATALRG